MCINARKNHWAAWLDRKAQCAPLKGADRVKCQDAALVEHQRSFNTTQVACKQGLELELKALEERQKAEERQKL